MAIFSRLNLVSKVTLATAAMMLVSFGIVVWQLYSTLSGQIIDQAQQRQNASLRLAAGIVARDMPGTQVEWTGEGNVARVIMADIPDAIDEHTMIDDIGRMTGETATIFKWDAATSDFWRKTTNIVKADGSRAIGTKLGQNGAVYPVVTQGKTFRGEAVILGTPYYTIYQPIVNPAGDIVGILYAGVRKAAVSAQRDHIMLMMLVVFIPITLISVTGMAFLARRILRPLPKIAEVAHAISSDDLDITVPYAERTDEVGKIAGAIDVLKQRARERHSLAGEQERSASAMREHQSELDRLIADFRQRALSLIGTVGDACGNLQSTAHELDTSSQHSAKRAHETMAASNRASANIQTMASAAQELSNSIQNITGQIDKTSDVVMQATRGTEATNEKISGLAAAANKIGDVVLLIQEIAEQTNLLALNATIEAARAGDAGRGFAVVAAEVKELATQTSKATEEISAQIAAIQAETGEAVKAIGSIAQTMQEVNSYTVAIADAVSQQGSATNDITDATQQVANDMASVIENMDLLEKTVNQTSSAAGTVTQASATLTDNTGSLRSEIDSFLSRVAAA